MGSLWHGVRQTGIQWTCFRSWDLITFPAKLIYSQLSHWTNENSHVSLIRPDVQYLNSSWLFCFRITPKGKSRTRSLGTLACLSLSLPLSKTFVYVPVVFLWLAVCTWSHYLCRWTHKAVHVYVCGGWMLTFLMTLCLLLHGLSVGLEFGDSGWSS